MFSYGDVAVGEPQAMLDKFIIYQTIHCSDNSIDLLGSIVVCIQEVARSVSIAKYLHFLSPCCDGAGVNGRVCSF